MIDLPKPLNKKRERNWIMKLFVVFSTTIIVAILELFITYLIEHEHFNLTTYKVSLFLLIAIISGICVEFFREMFVQIEEYNKQLILQIDYIGKLFEIIESHSAAIPNIKKLHEAFGAVNDKKHRAFIRDLIHESAIERIWLVPNYQNFQYYETLMNGFDICDNWRGIHQGSISLLQKDENIHLRNDYLEALKNFASKTGKTAQRIIIVKKESEYRMLLNDNSDEIRTFKETQGNVKSYFIKFETIEYILAGKDLMDAALLDNTIFLQYDRETLLLDFECGDGAQKAKIVRYLFLKLDTYLINPKVSAYKFHEIGN